MIFSCSKDGIIKITVLKWQTWFGDEAREKIRQLGHQDKKFGITIDTLTSNAVWTTVASQAVLSALLLLDISEK